MTDEWEDLDRSLLQRRAAALAAPRAAVETAVETLAILRFRLIGQNYAVPLDSVEAVQRIGDIVSIPLVPKHIQGVIRRRGRTIALVSLRHFFHPESEGIIDSDFAIIVVADGKRFAVQAEEIEGVFRCAKSALKPVPDNFDRAQSPFVQAVTVDGLILLDLDRLVTADGFSMDSPRGAVR